MGLERLPSSMLAGEFGSLGTNTKYGSYWEHHMRYRVWSIVGFLHMFYKLWLVGGGSKGYLEVII